jgi:hypothetical protein
MPVRIFCECGTEITKEVSLWDRKTRSVFWMDEHPPSCAACEKRHVASPAMPARDPSPRDAEVRKKVAAR